LSNISVKDGFNSKVALIGGKRCYYVEVDVLPVVQVSVWTGMSKEDKKKVVEGMTRVLEELGVPREAVTVIIYEAPKTNWATGGQLHSEKFANR
jgi:4-oxalocrotonate tautomerase